MTTTKTYDAEFLELAGRPGIEALRRECPCIVAWAAHRNMLPNHDDPCDYCYQAGSHAGDWCESCKGRNWLPLPEGLRLGALVRVAPKPITFDQFPDGEWGVVIGNGRDNVGGTPAAALTRAMLAATKP